MNSCSYYITLLTITRVKSFNIMVNHGVYYVTYYLTYYLMLSGGVKLYAENLGEFLRGDKIENSPYEVRAEKLRVYCVCILVDKR